jgi:hypothetical protein
MAQLAVPPAAEIEAEADDTPSMRELFSAPQPELVISLVPDAENYDTLSESCDTIEVDGFTVSPVGRRPAAAPSGPPGARQGIFQGISATGTWLPALDDTGLGVSSLAIDMTLGFPFPTRESPLLVTADFAVHYLESPSALDLPARVYDAWIQFRWLRRIGNRWAADLAVRPGVYSDFESDDNDALRIMGRGIAAFDWTPTTRLVFGVAYLARENLSVLPVGGLIITPNDDWQLSLLAPNPRISHRLPWYDIPTQRQCWAYVGGELGGGIWSIERNDGRHDTATLNDYRVLLGIERRVPGGLSRHVEVGYVFVRNIEFASQTPDYQPDDTLMLRVGGNY